MLLVLPLLVHDGTESKGANAVPDMKRKKLPKHHMMALLHTLFPGTTRVMRSTAVSSPSFFSALL